MCGFLVELRWRADTRVAMCMELVLPFPVPAPSFEDTTRALFDWARNYPEWIPDVFPGGPVALRPWRSAEPAGYLMHHSRQPDALTRTVTMRRSTPTGTRVPYVAEPPAVMHTRNGPAAAATDMSTLTAVAAQAAAKHAT